MNLPNVREESRDYLSKVDSLELKMLKFPQVECSVTHKFGPGIYMREVFLPAGTYVIGHHHNESHVNIFLKGRLTMIYEDHKEELKAPFSYVSGPGRKKAYIHEDSVWINVFSTNETDIETLETKFLTKSQGFIENKKEREQVMLLTSKIDQNDFLEFLKEFKLSKEAVKIISERIDDVTDLPFGDYKFKKAMSRIDGIGVFATGNYDPGEIIGPARLKGKRTILGRFVNHAAHPNAKMIGGSSGDIALIAIKNIKGCHGGQDGEEITVNYRESFKLTLEIGDKKCLR